MEQGLRVWGLAAVEGWVVAVKVAAGVKVWAPAGVEWAARLRLGRAETVFVRTAEQRLLILLDSLAMQRAVLSVERK